MTRSKGDGCEWPSRGGFAAEPKDAGEAEEHFREIAPMGSAGASMEGDVLEMNANHIGNESPSSEDISDGDEGTDHSGRRIGEFEMV